MRLRVSLRVLMLLVALSALCVGPVCRYVQTLRQKSREYADLAKGSADMNKSVKAKLRLRRLTPEVREATQKLADWHAKRGEAYTRAASRPWTTVKEDPRPETPPSAPVLDPFVFPPVRQPPKPPGEMTRAEQLEYGRRLAQDAVDLTERLKGRGARRQAIREEARRKQSSSSPPAANDGASETP